MASVIHTYLAQEWLQLVVDTPCYAGVFFEVPSDVNPGASECLTASYSRSLLTFSFTESTARTITSDQVLSWLNLEDTTIVGIGAWDAPVSGNLLAFWELDDAVPISGRGSWSLGAGELLLAL